MTRQTGSAPADLYRSFYRTGRKRDGGQAWRWLRVPALAWLLDDPGSFKGSSLWVPKFTPLGLLRDPDAAEPPWPDVRSRVEELMAEGKVRHELLAQEVAQEKHRPARERWLALSS
jgi:hypothetical protein